MKVALVSTGLGRVLRGFEAFTEGLFHALQRYTRDLDVTLFQSAGPNCEGRKTVPNFHRYDLPARWLGDRQGNILEKRSFALALYPLLRTGHFDVVHYNEVVFGSALFHLRHLLGGGFKLLYCNGAPSPPVHYHHRCDFAQVLHGPMHEEAVRFGIPESRLFLIPYGADGERFSPQGRSVRQAARRELGIPDGARVVLTVAALNRWHKRIDYLVTEIARLDREVWLLAAGQRTEETELLEQEATRFLPGRFRFVSWPQDRTHLLYCAADAFALCSLSEGFGLVTVEAMLSDLPVLVNDGPVFHWIAEGSDVRCINMAKPGALAEALVHAFGNGSRSNTRAEALSRFSWENLAGQYVDMYRAIVREKQT